MNSILKETLWILLYIFGLVQVWFSKHNWFNPICVALFIVGIALSLHTIYEIKKGKVD